MDFVDRMDKNSARYGLGIQMKESECPRFLNWSLLFFRMRGFCIVLTKMKTMGVVSLSFSKRCHQYSFSETFKGRQVIL